MGAAGATGIGLVAWRWSHASSHDAVPATVPSIPADDAALKEKLDDELRDLD
jgi:hypothetical protein